MTTTPDLTEHRGLLAVGSRLALVALLVLALPGEVAFAKDTLGMPWHIAWTVPVLVEGYFVVAIETGRDRRFAIPLLIGTVAIAYGTSLAQSLGLELAPAARFALLGLFVAAAVGVAARIAVLHQSSRRPAAEVPSKIDIDPRRSPETPELAPVFTEPRGGGVVPAEKPTATISDDWPPYGQWPKGEAGMRHARKRIAEYAREHGVLIPSGVLSDESGYPHDQQVRRARCPECRPQWLADELAAAGVTGEKASAAVCGGCRTKARRAS